MRSGDFELEIVGGQEAPDTGRVEMRHGQVYQIRLKTSRILDCQVMVNIDGEAMGTWVLEGPDEVTLEGPADERGCFTFYRAGSDEARATAPPDARESGIVSVWFLPEREPGSQFSLSAAPAVTKKKKDGDGAGVTGFTGEVTKNPPPAYPRKLWDMETAILIELRLVSEPVPAAAYRVLSPFFITCPACQQESSVPSGLGHIMATCPHCAHEFLLHT